LVHNRQSFIEHGKQGTWLNSRLLGQVPFVRLLPKERFQFRFGSAFLVPGVSSPVRTELRFGGYFRIAGENEAAGAAVAAVVAFE
jgi:hypothetical protein